jgi:RNA polymerase sigma-70 factor (ECF subfamily)
MLTLYLDRRRRDQLWGLLKRSVATNDGVAGPEDAIVKSSDVRASLAALSPRERTCVVLRHFDDLSVREIADRLGLAEGSVKRYLSDGLRRLGAEMTDDGSRVPVVTHGREGRD